MDEWTYGNKMILGSFVEEYDDAEDYDDDDHTTIGPASPHSRPDSQGAFQNNQTAFDNISGLNVTLTETPNASQHILRSKISTGQETLRGVTSTPMAGHQYQLGQGRPASMARPPERARKRTSFL